MTKPSGLPEVLAEIAEVAGIDAAWTLAREKGGTTVFIPRQAGKRHWLTKLVGVEAANAICRHFRDSSSRGGIGRDLLIPMASRAQDQQGWEQVLAGDLSLSETARLMKAHERTVSRHRARIGRRKAAGQGNLF